MQPRPVIERRAEISAVQSGAASVPKAPTTAWPAEPRTRESVREVMPPAPFVAAPAQTSFSLAASRLRAPRESPVTRVVVAPRSAPLLPPVPPAAAAPTPPVDVRIGTIEIRLAPAPPAPENAPPNEHGLSVDFDAYSRLRRYDAWER
jgi:hypothetical protein